MKVADREQTLQAGFEPGGAFARLAFGAMAIPTGVVGDPCETTVGAGIDMAAQRRGAALGQAPQDADLLMRDRMPSLIGRAVGAQDVPDFQGCRRPVPRSRVVGVVADQGDVQVPLLDGRAGGDSLVERGADRTSAQKAAAAMVKI